MCSVSSGTATQPCLRSSQTEICGGGKAGRHPSRRVRRPPPNGGELVETVADRHPHGIDGHHRLKLSTAAARAPFWHAPHATRSSPRHAAQRIGTSRGSLSASRNAAKSRTSAAESPAGTTNPEAKSRSSVTGSSKSGSCARGGGSGGRDRVISRPRLSRYRLLISAAAVSGSMLAASAMPARYSSVVVSGAVRFRS
jgi:hypothetical protein